VARSEGTNAFGPHSATPYLMGVQPAGEHVHVSLHLLRLDPVPDRPLRSPDAVVDVVVDGTTVTVRWVDDGTETCTDLATFVPWDGATASGAPR
jgi:hypothetical protein